MAQSTKEAKALSLFRVASQWGHASIDVSALTQEARCLDHGAPDARKLDGCLSQGAGPQFLFYLSRLFE